MSTTGKKRCAKCGRFSWFGYTLASTAQVLITSSATVPTGTKLQAGAFICKQHVNGRGECRGLLNLAPDKPLFARRRQSEHHA